MTADWSAPLTVDKVGILPRLPAFRGCDQHSVTICDLQGLGFNVESQSECASGKHPFGEHVCLATGDRAAIQPTRHGDPKHRVRSEQAAAQS